MEKKQVETSLEFKVFWKIEVQKSQIQVEFEKFRKESNLVDIVQ